jgi:hypothetical protein
MSINPKSYSVGFGKPPSDSKFRKGRSGNPGGRPKGAKSLASLLMESVNEQVTVTESGRRKQITKLEATTKQLANKAAQGDQRAAKLIFDMIQLLENRSHAANAALEQADQQVVETMLARLRLSFETGHDDNDTI